MILRATTGISAAAASALAAFTLAGLAIPAQAQQDVTEDNTDAVDVAMTPLTDLNLSRDPIPPILAWARDNPYSNEGLDDCEAIRAGIGDLDAVLGDDFDTAPPDSRGLDAGRVAQRVVGSFIPFRGIIREISGANNHEYNFRAAIGAGMMRRAYLKGLGEARGCDYPARPAPPEILARLRAGDGPGAAALTTEEQGDEGTRYVSREIVQPTAD